MGSKRDLEPEQRIWSDFHKAGGSMGVEEAREVARGHSGGHARRLGNLVQNGYIERVDNKYVVTTKGKRHMDRTFEDGLRDQ